MKPPLGWQPLLLLSALCGRWAATALNPLEQTVQLLTQLQATVVRDGELEEAAYIKYAHWCEAAYEDRAHEVKLAKRTASKLTATMEEASSEIKSSTATVEQLAKVLFTNEKKLKNAAEVRLQEESTFQTVEQELVESIDMLDRATRIMRKELQKHPTSFMQTKAGVESVQEVLQGLSAVVTAASLTSRSKQKLLDLLQSQSSEEALGAPTGAAYDSHSAGLLEVMEDLRGKAEEQLRNAREAEVKAKHNFQLVKLALEDEAETATKEMAEEKASRAAQEEVKAQAQGDSQVAVKQVKAATEALQSTQQACMQTASDHEQSVVSRKEELKAVTEAKQVIQASMGAASTAYSLVQTGSMSALAATSTLRNTISSVRKLAQRQHSQGLTQLADRLAALSKYGRVQGQEPFGKVRALIEDMLARLEQELNQESRRQTYCEREKNKTDTRQEALQDQVEGLRSRIDQLVSKSVDLKGQVQDLQTELADLAELQVYVSARSDLQQGLEGTRTAIRVLRDYYATQEDGSLLQMQNGAAIEAEVSSGQPAMPGQHRKAEGAAGIIGMLEVIESDIAESLAKTETEEDSAKAEYESLTQENDVLKKSKEKDVTYKNKESKGVEKAISELGGDKDSSEAELEAVEEYMARIREQCDAKPDTFAERKQRRQEQIDGLQDALGILTGTGASSSSGFLQRRIH